MSPKPISRRHILAGAAVVVPVGAISLLAPTEAHAGGESRPSRAESVVTRYFGILNAGMASANADFSALATVYAKGAALTHPARRASPPCTRVLTPSSGSMSPRGRTSTASPGPRTRSAALPAPWCSATSMPADLDRPSRACARTCSRCTAASSAPSTGSPTTRVCRKTPSGPTVIVDQQLNGACSYLTQPLVATHFARLRQRAVAGSCWPARLAAGRTSAAA